MTMKEINNRLAKLIEREFYLQMKDRWTPEDYEDDRKDERRNKKAERRIKEGVKMKKVYTERELDALIRIYGFEHKKVIAYAKRLDKQARV